MKSLLFWTLLLIGPVFTIVPEHVTHARPFTVTKADDTNDGVCDTDCSLREAVIAANTSFGADVITFSDLTGSPDVYTIALAGTGEDNAATGDFDILDTLTITGNGQDETIIDGDMLDRVFDVCGANVTFENMTIRGGRSPEGPGFLNEGGGIAARPNGGTSHLIVKDCRVINNRTATGNGGGISIAKPLNGISPSLKLIRTEVLSNTASYGGGGISCRNCDLEIIGCSISSNIANVSEETGFGGGGISATGKGVRVAIGNSTISDNESLDDGGGILFGGAGVMNIDGCTISDNRGFKNGGGIADESALTGGTVTVKHTVIVSNTVLNEGGGIFNHDATMEVSFNRISSNSAAMGSGIVNNAGTVNAENNWWGCDAFPGEVECDSIGGNIDTDPRLDLQLSVNPTSIAIGGKSTLAVDLSRNSAGDVVLPKVLVGLSVTFVGAGFGNISPSTATIGDNFIATTNFTGVASGRGIVSAALEGGTQTAPIVVVLPSRGR